MNYRLALCALALTAASACGGGGGGSSPAPVPTNTAPAAGGNLPLSQTVGSGPAWVDPSSHKTLYYLDVDTPTGGTCTGGCLAVWPVFAPAAGSQATGNMAIITRSDGTGTQWAYNANPLYTFTGDSGPAQTNGDNFPDFGGHWHVARPGTTTPPPGQSPPPCHGNYC